MDIKLLTSPVWLGSLSGTVLGELTIVVDASSLRRIAFWARGQVLPTAGDALPPRGGQRWLPARICLSRRNQ